MIGDALCSDQAPPDSITREERCVAFLKKEYPSWRAAWVAFSTHAPGPFDPDDAEADLDLGDRIG